MGPCEVVIRGKAIFSCLVQKMMIMVVATSADIEVFESAAWALVGVEELLELRSSCIGLHELLLA
jgi:hypothetical protein